MLAVSKNPAIDFITHVAEDTICLLALLIFTFVLNRCARWVADRTNIPTFKFILRCLEIFVLWLAVASFLFVGLKRFVDFLWQVWDL